MFDTTRVETLAKENGLSNSFLAKRLGRTSASLFVDWRKGKSKPSGSDIERLADILHTTTDFLLGNTDIKEKPSEVESFSSEDIIMAKKIQSLTKEQRLKLEGYVDSLLNK